MAACADRSPQRILIIKPSSLGDIVHALPVLAGLRREYPRAHIAWLVGQGFAPVLAGHPLLDEVIPFDRRRYGRMLQSWGSVADFVRFVGALRRRRFELVVDLQGLIRSGFLAWASGARRRVGFAAAREFGWAFYTQRVRCLRNEQHAVQKNLHLARTLGVPVDPPEFPLGLSAAEIAAARELLARVAGRPIDRFTAILPGARWETKRWRADRFAALIGRLHSSGFSPCVLLGAPEERAFADPIVAAGPPGVVDGVGRTSLRELCAVIALADLVICHDSGPMHIAAALGKPLVAIFGPTNPARTGPYCSTARIAALPLPCAPCYQRRCPLGHHNCMQQLDVADVLDNVRELRAQAHGEPHAPR
jgi:lipopolysaccharide heptosyltransferase I